jgi:uncharacterized protein YecT (DUF1311 family)
LEYTGAILVFNQPGESQLNFIRRAIALVCTCMLPLASMALTAAEDSYPNVGGEIREKSEWVQQCLRVRAKEPPRQDLLPAGGVAAPKDCDANDLYYDTKSMSAPTGADWGKVRSCAFATKDTGVLTMLYANGSGVAKDLKLATKYACSTSSAIAEMAGRVENLSGRMSTGQHKDFDFCEDITSGYMQGMCAGIYERQQAKGREARLAALVKNWPGKDQAAFTTLRNALNAFAEHRGHDETDASGSARGAQALEASAAELDQFMKDIMNFEAGKLPAFTSAEFDKLDRRLNTVYQTFMRIPDLSESMIGTIKQVDVKKTQRAWLVYRDAMVAFGAARYPKVTAAAWKALLTERRIKQLSEFAEAAKQP